MSDERNPLDPPIEATPVAPRRRRGRPKGSKNRPVEASVITVPTVCPYCGSADHRVKRGSKPQVREAPIDHPKFGRIKRRVIRRRLCDACGREFFENEFHPEN